MEWAESKSIIVPEVGLKDGMILHLYEKRIKETSGICEHARSIKGKEDDGFNPHALTPEVLQRTATSNSSNQ